MADAPPRPLPVEESPAVTGPAVRNDPPIVTDWGMVVRVIGGVVIVGPIAVTQGTVPWIVAGTVTADQGAPNIDANSWPVHQVGALPAGANIIGVVGIDPAQTGGLNLEATQAAVQALLASIDGDIDVALSTRASEATLAAVQAAVAAIQANVDVALSTRASEATLAAVQAAVAAIQANFDVALSTRASEATLQTLHAAGTLANGAETVVAGVAVSILAANAARKTAIVQNTGVANIRVGVAGVTAATGLRLTPGDYVVYSMPDCPTQQLFAIREGAISSVAFAQEIT